MQNEDDENLSISAAHENHLMFAPAACISKDGNFLKNSLSGCEEISPEKFIKICEQTYSVNCHESAAEWQNNSSYKTMES